MDNAVDNAIGFPNTHPLAGKSLVRSTLLAPVVQTLDMAYPMFEQPGPVG